MKLAFEVCRGGRVLLRDKVSCESAGQLFGNMTEASIRNLSFVREHSGATCRFVADEEASMLMERVALKTMNVLCPRETRASPVATFHGIQVVSEGEPP